LRCHIIPSLGDCAFSELTPKRLQGFITRLSNGARTRKTIENILLTLSSILSTARTWGYDIPKVSLSALSLPQDTPHEVHCFTLDEMRRILRTADESLSTICFILSATGMRIGEVLALRRQDLDFQRWSRFAVRATAGRSEHPRARRVRQIYRCPLP
jgi:integrase